LLQVGGGYQVLMNRSTSVVFTGQGLGASWLFPQGTLVGFFTNKTDPHNKTNILLKVVIEHP
jgi:hypothetical protein